MKLLQRTNEQMSFAETYLSAINALRHRAHVEFKDLPMNIRFGLVRDCNALLVYMLRRTMNVLPTVPERDAFQSYVMNWVDINNPPTHPTDFVRDQVRRCNYILTDAAQLNAERLAISVFTEEGDSQISSAMQAIRCFYTCVSSPDLRKAEQLVSMLAGHSVKLDPMNPGTVSQWSEFGTWTEDVTKFVAEWCPRKTAPQQPVAEPKPKRKNLTKKMKQLVWDTYAGQGVGAAKCCCCHSAQITPFEFECGHIVAVAKGGTNVLPNLRPVCSLCNKSMGTTNMRDFVQENGFPPLT